MDDEKMTGGTLPADRSNGFESLLDVARLAVSSAGLDDVLQQVLQSAMTVMAMPAGVISLYDANSYRLEIRAEAGLDRGLAERGPGHVQPGSPAHELLAGGELCIVEDAAAADLADSLLAPDLGIRAAITVPLRVDERTVGVLCLGDFTPRDLAAQDQQLLPVLASFAAMSIECARLKDLAMQGTRSDGSHGRYEQEAFEEAFAAELARAKRYENSLSIILCAVDDFDQFRDAFGLPVGEALLRELANMLRELLRDSDQVFRYDGEVFVAILPETPRSEAGKVAERIRIFVETESPRFLTQITKTRGVTVSVGVAALHDDGGDLPALLQVVASLAKRGQGR